MKTIVREPTDMFGATLEALSGRTASARFHGYRWLRCMVSAAVVVVVAGCTYSGPITSTLMLNGDEAFLPKVSNFSTSLATSSNGLVLRPGDVLFLSQQTFPPKGAEVGELYGRRAPSDLGVLRLPLRKVGLNSGPKCDEAAVGVNALSPSEQLVISTLLANVRQRYTYQASDFVEGDSRTGLAWGNTKEKFLRVLEKCNGRLWNTFVDGLRAHVLNGSKKRLVLSIDLEAMRMALPDTWHEPIPSEQNPNGLTPQHVFGYVFINKYSHESDPESARVELSTLSGLAYNTFGHVLDQTETLDTYGDVFSPRNEKEFRPRFIPRHMVLLNGVDFRSDDLDREEMHWTLKEVEDSKICIDLDANKVPVARSIVSLRHDPQDRALVLFDDRRETIEPQKCDITVGVQSVPDDATDLRRQGYLGPQYFDYPLELPPINPKEDFGNPGVCGPTWIWRANTGHVAHATRVTEIVPIHSVSELVWSGALASVDMKPSLLGRCLVK